jgi:hypothetical protein
MPLVAPVLDDRSFDQIRAELLDRIDAYNPEWTDRSRSDPAVTLLELFAFLGESLQFRFNQIPEATRLAFLQLLDLPLRPAQPARALVRATPRPGQLAASGLQFYAGDQVRAGRTIFTVDTDATCWPLDCLAVARLSAAMPSAADEPELNSAVQATIDAVADAHPGLTDVTPYRTAVLASDGSAPPVDFSAAIDGSLWIAVLADPAPADAGVPISVPPGETAALSIGVSPAATAPTLAEIAPCPGGAGGERPSLEWRATAASLTPSGAPRMLPLRIAGDTTEGFAVEGAVRVELPADLAVLGVPPAPAGLEGTGDFPPVIEDPGLAAKVWFWLRVWRSDGSHRLGALRLVCLNALTCTQAVAAAPELLGSGSGQPGQSYPLANRPVLLGPQHEVAVQVQEEGLWTDWQRRDDLEASGAGDRHFTVDAEAGLVRFGERGPQIGERVKVARYFYGGGVAGNVPARAITALGDPLPGAPVPLGKRRPADAPPVLLNPFKAAGGADSESLEAALERIPGELRRRTRAVTASDFAELALQTPGVELGRAECLPLFHAPDQAYPWPGAVSVVIWPAHDARSPDAPLPDAAELRRVCRWLDGLRLVTTELYVIPPTYREIAISVAVKVKDGFGLDAVRNWVELVLRRYLSPLPPYGPAGAGWPLGRRVLDRELEGVALQVEGVEYVEDLRLAGRVNGALTAMASVPMERWMVPVVSAVTVVDEATPLPDPGSLVAPPPSGNPVPIPVLREEC